ncbi:MAG: hypothetical protein JKX95_03005 [Bacteroidia bacterium]|nr:hypothetical protein [Bacteroidia bacterium]
MNKEFFWFLLLASSIFTACESDIDINDDWEEVTIIYGLLDPSDSVQYIKVNKAFLGEGAAYGYAAVHDSIYHQDSIEVTLTAWDGNSKKKEIILLQDRSIPKDSGSFSYPDQILYRTPPGDTLDSNYEYELTVTRVEKDELVATAKTKLIKDFQISTPSVVSTATIGFADQNKYKLYNVSIVAAENGRLYELVVRFNYKEVDILSGDTTLHSLDWQAFSKVKAKNELLDGIENISKKIDGKLFYYLVNSSIQENANVIRIASTLDFMFFVGGEELSTYIDVNNAQVGLTTIKVKPEYTNVDGGLGIFSSRFQKILRNKELSDYSIDSLACGSITGKLGFLDSDFETCN